MSSSSSPSTESNFLAQLEGPQLEQLQLEVQQQIKLVRGVFVELNRLLKAINLYGAEHQSVRQFRVRFFQSITQALEEWGGFTLDVQSYELSLAEQTIHEDPSPENNFIYRFYSDGIRQISFSPGLSSGETEQLLDILLTNWSDPDLFEDDAVTVFWRAGFRHIQIQTLRGFGTGESTAEAHLFSLDGLLDELSELAQGAAELGSYPSEQSRGECVSLSSEERLWLLPRSRERFEKFVEISFLAQARERGSQQRAKLIELFGTLGMHFLRLGDSGSFERILRQMLRAPADEFGELLKAMRTRLASLSSVELLFASLTEEDSPTQASALASLELLAQEAAPGVALHLHRAHARYLPRLELLLSAQVDSYPIEYCRAIRGSEGVREVELLLRTLRSAKDPSVLERGIRTAWGSADQGIRRAALDALPEGAGAFRELLFEALLDPASRTRKTAFLRIYQSAVPEDLARLQRALSELLPQVGGLLSEIEFKKLAAYYGALIREEPEHRAWLLRSLEEKRRGAEGERWLAALLFALTTSLAPEAAEQLKRFGGRLLAPAALREASAWGSTYLGEQAEGQSRLMNELLWREQLSHQRR